MYLEVDYDHRNSVCSALKYSFHSTTACDKIYLVSQSGDKLFISISFLSVFSNLVRCIGENNQDLPVQMFVPINIVTLKKLLLFLCEGNLVSNNPEDLQEVIEAAEIFAIETQAWTIIEAGSVNVAPSESISLKEEFFQQDAQRSISMGKVEFKDLDWEDCKIETGEREIDLEYKLSVSKKYIKGGLLENVTRRRRGRPRKMITDELYFCPECPCEFSSRSKLSCHYVTKHTGNNSFTCGKCSKRFKSKHGLQYHVLTFHDDPTEIKEACSYCENVFLGSGVTEHDRISSASLKKKVHNEMFHGDFKEIWVCDLCCSKFSQRSLLDKHMQGTHADDDVPLKNKCTKPGCGKMFANKSVRISHEKHTHGATLDKPCTVKGCGKIFSHHKSRLLHEKTHDPSNFKFPCDQCDNKYMHKSNLLVHKETHNPWRKCDNCGEVFKSKQKLEVHVQRCTSEPKFQCQTCGKKFVRHCRLKRHIVGHSGIKPFSCKPCNRSFTHKEYLHSHLKRKMCKENRTAEITNVTNEDGNQG